MAGLLEYLQLTPFQPKDLLVVISLVILEGLLSCDNAVALALLVRDLPPHQQSKALRYGIIGAYVFRVIAILAATWIIRQWYLKALGGLYLLWVAGQHFFGKKEEGSDPDAPPATRQFGKLSVFWSMVILVELTDIAFSVDSIAASVALSNKIWVLIVGGMLGILAMRFAAQGFILLLEKHPSLEGAAFAAVAFIGLKLLLEMPLDVVGQEATFTSPPTYTTVESYEEQAHAAQSQDYIVPHVVSLHTKAGPRPDRARFASDDDYLRAQGFWSLHMRPFIHIDSMFSSLLVMGMFGLGFLGRRQDEKSEPEADPPAN